MEGGSTHEKLRAHFAGDAIADMLCLLRLRAELAVNARGLLMMREAGFRAAPGPEVGRGSGRQGGGRWRWKGGERWTWAIRGELVTPFGEVVGSPRCGGELSFCSLS